MTTFFTEAVFLLLVGLTLTGALLAVIQKNVFYNALALILCLCGVSGLFVYLNSEFLAILEVIIYIGAISIAIIFGIMLSRPMQESYEWINPGKALRSMVLAFLLFGVLARTLALTFWPVSKESGDYSVQNIGRALLSKQAFPFEAISLILLIAIIGALVISNSGEKDL